MSNVPTTSTKMQMQVAITVIALTTAFLVAMMYQIPHSVDGHIIQNGGTFGDIVRIAAAPIEPLTRVAWTVARGIA